MKQRRAFTLIELLVVITIIGILLILVLPAYATMQMRARLQNNADVVAQMFQQGKTFASTGVQTTTNTTELSIIGLYIAKNSSHLILFSRPLSDVTMPVYSASSPTLQTYSMGDMRVRKIISDMNQDTAVVLFYPPFGDAMIVSNENMTQKSPSLTIEIGSADGSTSLQKQLEFTAFTNRLNPL